MKPSQKLNVLQICFMMMLSMGIIMVASCGKEKTDSTEKKLEPSRHQETSNPKESETNERRLETASAETSLKIGVAGAHSGEFSTYGIPTLNAVTMVVDEINHKGGFLGKKIKVIAVDDNCRPELASQKAEHLIHEKVFAVIGHTCSSSTLSALHAYNKSGILCISPSATNADLTLSGNYPLFFRSVANDRVQTKAQVEFSVHKLHAQKAAIIYTKDDYGTGMATFAKQYFEESGLATVVLFEGVSQSLSDFNTLVEKIKKSKPDLLMWEGYYPEASLFIKQMRSKNIKTPLIGSDGLKVDHLISSVGEWTENIYVSAPQSAGKNNIITIKAINDYNARFGSEPGPFFINAYSAAMALTNAMKRSESTDSANLAKTLRSEFVDTPLGRISFDEKGDIVGTGFSMYQLKNGAFKEIWP